jgi:hypothetical protein
MGGAQKRVQCHVIWNTDSCDTDLVYRQPCILAWS